MVWFHCEDCGESLKKQKLRRHFSICTAKKLSCIDCGNMFGQDSVRYHNQCMTEAEKYGLEQPYSGNNSKQLIDFDMNAELFNTPSWFCSLCNAKMNCEKNYFAHVYGKKHREKAKELSDKQKQQSEEPAIDKANLKQLPDIDIYVGLSNHYPWFCSLCNTTATSHESLLSHANGKKHRANIKGFDAKQYKQQSEHSTVDKDNSKNRQKSIVDVGLSHPWFCSLCNTKATSEKSFLSHTNGRKHRENVELFDANQQQQQQQLDKSMVDKKYTIEYASDGEYESKKVVFPVASGFAHGYSQGVRKRKLETFDETWNEEVLQAEEAKGGTKKKSESKKAKQQNEIVDLVYKSAEKKQTKSDSDFEYDKEDIKQLLLSYSKEEIVDLVYKTAEKGSRLITAILELADCDIAQRNIYVRGFGWDTTHENLKAAFESYGEIEECSVVMDKDTGRGKGYGFVLFKTRKGAREALRNPQKRLYNRTVVCNLASKKPSGTRKGQDMVEPVKIDLTNVANQSEVALPGLELAHRHILEKRQQTMDMLGQNMPYYGQSQLPGFDPMYGGSQMVAGLPNYCMFGSGMMMNQGSMMNHMGMAEQCFGDGKHVWYQR